MKNKTQQQQLVEMLQNRLNEVEQMWEENKSHAYIIGYLQGTIKTVIIELED
jgi:hypothetical protein